MKKFLCIFLCALMVLSVMSFVSCTETPAENPTEAPTEAPATDAALKLGLGVHISAPTVADATEDKNGSGKVSVTAAVITVDADGKIVACQLDTMENSVAFTLDGKAVAGEGFKTKHEQGADYNMVAWGGAAKEWFEQADAFETVVVGKTLNEIKALVAEADKGTDEVISAGCTIMVAEFVKAVEAAFGNLAESTVTAENTLKLGMTTEQTTADATEDKDGYNQVETTVFAAAVDANGKVVAATTDCVQVKFTFNLSGAATLDTTKAVASKRQQGVDYNMVAWGGAAKEWFEQADAFAALCVGKTATEIAALAAADNYGTDDVKNAGCTILVNGFVKAAAKIG